jgi:hypothetical protein
VLKRPGAVEYKTPDEAVQQMARGAAAVLIGTPDDMISAIKNMLKSPVALARSLALSMTGATAKPTLDRGSYS